MFYFLQYSNAPIKIGASEIGDGHPKKCHFPTPLIYPEEIKTGISNPLRKPGKGKGPVQNLRPVILLSVLRKIQAVCTINRLDSKLRSIIPISQCAYSRGRSTMELILTFIVE